MLEEKFDIEALLATASKAAKEAPAPHIIPPTAQATTPPVPPVAIPINPAISFVAEIPAPAPAMSAR